MIFSDLTAEIARGLILYSPDTGNFEWRTGPRVGLRVGSVSSLGYLRVQLLGKQYRAHRLAWLLMTGCWPTHEVDHINGIRTDNRWCNLRDIPGWGNRQNQRSARTTNSTGLLGASRLKNGRFIAQIQVGGKNFNLGRFDTAELAHSAYLAAKRSFHAFCSI